MGQVLIVDDEPSICWALQQALQEEGHTVTTLSSAEQARQWYAEQTPDVIVMDVRLPGQDGLSAITSFPEHLAETPVIVMTAFGNLETAVQAIGSGAFEYLPKPFELEAAIDVISRAIRKKQTPLLPSRSEQTAEQLQEWMIGKSAAMQAVFRQIALVAQHDVPVLITGESGSGKELVAQAIHRYGLRSQQQLIPVCVPALSEGVLESELFGHRGGAFTGAVADRPGLLAAAHKGTAFFDEIGDIALTTQVKLLRVLETRAVTPVGSNQAIPCDFRLIAATNRQLETLVAEGTFREDLFYRLNVFRIELPPLRARREDIPLLADHFLRQLPGVLQYRCTEAAMQELMRRDWPGNIRELRNAVEHAAIYARDGRIDCAHLPPCSSLSGKPAIGTAELDQALQRWLEELPPWEESQPGWMEQLLQRIEPLLLRHTLEATSGNRQEAAQRLGIHRQTLRDKLRRYGLDE